AEVRRHQRPSAVEPLALQPDGQPAVLLLLEELVRAVIPDLHRARAVRPGRNLALEGRVVERVVLDMDGEVLLPGLERPPLRPRPAPERPVALEPKVVVQAARVMPLDDEDRVLRLSPLLPAER